MEPFMILSSVDPVYEFQVKHIYITDNFSFLYLNFTCSWNSLEYFAEGPHTPQEGSQPYCWEGFPPPPIETSRIILWKWEKIRKSDSDDLTCESALLFAGRLFVCENMKCLHT